MPLVFLSVARFSIKNVRNLAKINFIAPYAVFEYVAPVGEHGDCIYALSGRKNKKFFPEVLEKVFIFYDKAFFTL